MDGTHHGTTLAIWARGLLALSLSLSLSCAAAGCGGVEELTPLGDDCSTEAINVRLYQHMKDVYLWHDRIPDVDPRAYSSPEELLGALRYEDLDRWSRLTRGDQTAAYFSDGRSIGLGVRFRHDAGGAVRFAIVYPGAPASDAGIQRGDELLALNGRTVAEIDAGDLWATILGEDQEGVPVDLELRKPDGEVLALTLLKRAFDVPTVSAEKILDVDGRKVGYLLVDRFISPSFAELFESFSAFKAAGVEDLMLDMRYNGGGLTEGARVLASLIGGKDLDARLFNLLAFNDRHPELDARLRFDVQEHSLNLPRVVIIGTDSTASASEMVINGLRSWMDVALIGRVTHGKPVGMVSRVDCDTTLIPVMFRVLNADGEGGYFDGLAPDCDAEDGLTAPFGDESEASLAAAIGWLRAGSCASPPPPGARKREAILRYGPDGEPGIF